MRGCGGEERGGEERERERGREGGTLCKITNIRKWAKISPYSCISVENSVENLCKTMWKTMLKTKKTAFKNADFLLLYFFYNFIVHFYYLPVNRAAHRIVTEL